jgi:hypothetical protein
MPEPLSSAYIITTVKGVKPDYFHVYDPPKLVLLADIYKVGRDGWASIGDIMINTARALCVAFVFYWINTYFKYRRILDDWFKNKEAKRG